MCNLFSAVGWQTENYFPLLKCNILTFLYMYRKTLLYFVLNLLWLNFN